TSSPSFGGHDRGDQNPDGITPSSTRWTYIQAVQYCIRIQITSWRLQKRSVCEGTSSGRLSPVKLTASRPRRRLGTVETVVVASVLSRNDKTSNGTFVIAHREPKKLWQSPDVISHPAQREPNVGSLDNVQTNFGTCRWKRYFESGLEARYRAGERSTC